MFSPASRFRLIAATVLVAVLSVASPVARADFQTGLKAYENQH